MYNLVVLLVLLAVREHNARLSADGGEGTDAAAVQLVSATGPQDLKVECLVKLPQLL